MGLTLLVDWKPDDGLRVDGKAVSWLNTNSSGWRYHTVRSVLDGRAEVGQARSTCACCLMKRKRKQIKNRTSHVVLTGDKILMQGWESNVVGIKGDYNERRPNKSLITHTGLEKGFRYLSSATGYRSFGDCTCVNKMLLPVEMNIIVTRSLWLVYGSLVGDATDIHLWPRKKWVRSESHEVKVYWEPTS